MPALITFNRHRRLALLVLLPIAIACGDRWEEPHHDGIPLTERPECPTTWGDSLPWFEPSDVRSTVYLAAGVTYQQIPGGVPGTGPITDIPEFHDCQRFLSANGLAFDSLFAVFAAYKQDSIVGALAWDSVTWSSSDIDVATVNGSGMVTGVGAGTTTILAKSVSPGVTATRMVKVLQEGAFPPNPTSIQMGIPGLDSLTVNATRQAVVNFGEPTTFTLPVGTIYSYGQDYPRLGIKANFNCLYLYFDAHRELAARVVPVLDLGSEIDACAKARNPNENVGTVLKVVRTKIALDPKESLSPYPSVARWDWDPKTGTQFVGVGCGDAWCEIGMPNARGVFDPPDPYVLGPGARPGDVRVVSVKGWHDEQVLAVPDPNDDTKLIPSSLRGTVIPDPDLATKGWTETGPSEWKTAAYLALVDLSGTNSSTAAKEFYRSRLNLVPADVGELKELNALAYCYGVSGDCDGVGIGVALKCAGPAAFFSKRWWARVTPAPTSNDRPKFFCLVRRTHVSTAGPLPTIPSTSRWRWILRDDTVWSECIQGCCETKVGNF